MDRHTAYHASCTTAGTETPVLAAEGNKFQVMAGLQTNSQESMFQTTTLQVAIELSNHISWQLLALRRLHCFELRPVALTESIGSWKSRSSHGCSGSRTCRPFRSRLCFTFVLFVVYIIIGIGWFAWLRSYPDNTAPGNNDDDATTDH